MSYYQKQNPLPRQSYANRSSRLGKRRISNNRCPPAGVSIWAKSLHNRPPLRSLRLRMAVSGETPGVLPFQLEVLPWHLGVLFFFYLFFDSWIMIAQNFSEFFFWICFCSSRVHVFENWEFLLDFWILIEKIICTEGDQGDQGDPRKTRQPTQYDESPQDLTYREKCMEYSSKF